MRWSCSAAWGGGLSSFGAETAGREQLLDTARVLLDSRLSEALRPYLDRGLSFPATRSRAAADLGADATVLERPNIFGVLQGHLAQGGATDAPAHCPARGLPRPGGRPGQPLATALRLRILTGQPWLSHVPEAVRPAYGGGAPQLGLGRQAILARLRTLGEDLPCFPALRRDCESCVRECRRQNTLEEIFDGGQVQAVHLKPTGSNGLCACLGLSAAELSAEAPYVRILGFRDRGSCSAMPIRGLPLCMPGKPGRALCAVGEAVPGFYGLFAREEDRRRSSRSCVLP